MAGDGGIEVGLEPTGVTATDERTGGSITRGFLFADLRGYTRFVETRGAAVAANLLLRYRALVRDLVGRYAGAEIKTEGDSFYVVFTGVSTAVQCGLAIVDAARISSLDHPDEPISVGIGIHAGETIETPDGFVGSPVNIAARLCALAGPGEVLVSDTVRALTQTVLPVGFLPRGRRTLKGVADQVAVYAVVPRSEWGLAAVSVGRLRGLSRTARVAVLGAVVIAFVGIALLGFTALRGAAGLPAGPWKIGVDMPLQGPASGTGITMRNAVALAIDQANDAGGIGGAHLTLDSVDDASATTANDPVLGATNVTAMVADPRVLAMVGPLSSAVAREEIPIANRAGLLQCSPANTAADLTKPRDGALDLRSAFPTRIAYVRTAPSDDIQGTALATFMFTDLAVKTTLVIDDSDSGRKIADSFSAAYTKLGGVAVRLALNPGADPASVLGSLSASTGTPTAVFFGGVTPTGAPNLRKAMVAAGHGALPFVSWDGIQDGSGAVDGSFIAQAGPAAAGSYSSHASIGLPKADFTARYRAKFGTDPGEYGASAYACAEIILQSLRAVAATGPSAEGLREALRAYVVDPSRRFETVIGTIGFDANGDSLQQFVTFYRVEMSAAGGQGDWVIEKQQDYGPAP
jgi:branched-chain amino acid transport system substrate-binding protein